MKELENKTEAKTPVVQPACSISEADGKVLLRVEMPGVDKGALEISIEKNELTIAGKPLRFEEEGTWLLRERNRGDYRKRFILDESIDREKIEAVMVDGILTLTLATKETSKPKKIEIK